MDSIDKQKFDLFIHNKDFHLQTMLDEINDDCDFLNTLYQIFVHKIKYFPEEQKPSLICILTEVLNNDTILWVLNGKYGKNITLKKVNELVNLLDVINDDFDFSDELKKTNSAKKNVDDVIHITDAKDRWKVKKTTNEMYILSKFKNEEEYTLQTNYSPRLKSSKL